jgi:hypothetical protein
LSQEKLESALKDGKSYSQAFHERRRQRNAELIAEIKQRRAAAKAGATIKAGNGGNGGTNRVHSTSTSMSATVSAGVSTLIKTPVTETHSIEAFLTQSHKNKAAPAFLKEK